MTEKRFTIVNMGLDGQFIKDNGKIMLIDDVVDVLNAQHKEIRELKITIKEHQKYIEEQRHEDINELSVIAMKYKALEKENEQLKSRINELEEKVYHNLAWFLMYKDYFGIDLGEAIWNNADIQNHEQERELLNEYISIAKKRYRI